MVDSLMHWLGYGLCHQLPERSFFGGGVQLPVCARDTGIYLGFIIAVGVIALLHRRERPTGFPSPMGWVVFALMVGSMGIDGVSSYSGLRTTTNELRLITGLMTGFAIAMLVVPMVNDVLWRRSGAGRVLDPVSRLLSFLVVIPFAYMAIWWGAPFLGVGYALLTAAAIITTLVSVNLVMVCLLPAFDRKAEKLADAWMAILVSFLLAGGEIWLAAGLRIWLTNLAERLT
ncbi:MAG: DUF2085 domain-containing protein [Coriobacteriia bacterium]|nr:DUF2085 domain-containing protein [Coriobacteriia bacterium]